MPRKRKQPPARPSALDRARIYLEQGIDCLRERDWTGAFAACNKAVGLYPEGAGRAHASYFRGIARYRLGDPLRAIDDFTQAIAGAFLSAERADAYAYRGLARLAEKDYAGAIDDLTHAIQDYPDDHADDDTSKAEAYANRGLARHRAGDLAGALDDYAEALARHAPPALVHYNVACTHSQMGDPDRACQSLARAFDRDPALRQDARDDPDLHPLRNEPCFQDLIWNE